MTEEESSNEESKRVKFMVLDPKKATGKDIVAFWIAEMKKLADAEKDAQTKVATDQKNEP
jgi:hypothetical protein